MIRRVTGAASIVVALFDCNSSYAQQGDGTEVQVTTNGFKPNKVAPTSERVGQLKVPEGFSVKPFAQGLGNSRIIAVSDKGFIYVSRREEGDVLLLKDEDGDGKEDRAPIQVVSRAQAHGLAIKGDKLYLVTMKEVFVADIKADGTLGELEMIIGDLPDSGQHPNRVLEFGPDGMPNVAGRDRGRLRTPGTGTTFETGNNFRFRAKVHGPTGPARRPALRFQSVILGVFGQRLRRELCRNLG